MERTHSRMRPLNLPADETVTVEVLAPIEELN
jgi:hypothetical protein